MNILLQSKEAIEAQLGRKGVIAPHVLGMVAQGEKAYSFSGGSLAPGFEITVGFFGDRARYVAFKKTSQKKWDESDIRASLMQVGSFTNWTSKPGSDFFDYVEKDGAKVLAEATGWQTPARKYAFAYVPTVNGDVGITPNKATTDARFAAGT